MTGGCRERRPDLGAYVMGALDPGERAALEAHLDTCPPCRDEVAGLAGLPGLLARLSPDEVEPAPPAPEHLVDRMLAEVARRRSRRRRAVLAAVGAGLALAAGGAVVALHADGSDPGPAPLRVAAAGADVRARATLRPEPWGTRVTLAMRDGVPGARCRIVVVGRDGRREVAATWRADYEGTATVRGGVAIPLHDVAWVVVEADGRGPLVRIRV